MADSLIYYILRLLFALLVGGLIGIEREIKDKPAGMRTNMLMCTGSCLLMILSIEVARYGGPPSDPGRIAAQVVTGVGFLGAGTIIRSGLSITGLTTAATIWLVSALGLVIGTGNFILGGVSAILIIITLTLLGRVETHLAVRQQRHILKFRLHNPETSVEGIKRLLYRNRITADDISLTFEDGAILFDIEYIAPNRKHQAMLEIIRNNRDAEVMIDF